MKETWFERICPLWVAAIVGYLTIAAGIVVPPLMWLADHLVLGWRP